jgi:hypothetical protein
MKKHEPEQEEPDVSPQAQRTDGNVDGIDEALASLSLGYPPPVDNRVGVEG